MTACGSFETCRPHENCPLQGQDRKRSADRQNGANDPIRTSRPGEYPDCRTECWSRTSAGNPGLSTLFGSCRRRRRRSEVRGCPLVPGLMIPSPPICVANACCFREPKSSALKRTPRLTKSTSGIPWTRRARKAISAITIALQTEAISIIFHFMEPFRAVRDGLRSGWMAELKHAL
jgi:hypothetical protein